MINNRRKTILHLMLLITLVLISCNRKQDVEVDQKLQQDGSANNAKKNHMLITPDDQQLFYSTGHLLGSRLTDLHLEDQELDFIIEGFKDGALNRAVKIKIQNGDRVQEFLGNQKIRNMQLNRNTGIRYLKEFSQQTDVQLTPSGIAYKIILPGNNGVKNSIGHRLSVHYRAKLPDGQVVDSTSDYKHGLKLPFEDLLSGLQELTRLIGEGGKIHAVIPDHLAYGELGKDKIIPPGSYLYYEFEIIKIW